MNKNGEIIIYNTEDNQIKIEVSLQDETVWLSQKQMAVLFNKDVRTINEHIQNTFKDKELERELTIRNFRIVEKEGSRNVFRNIKYYNLDVIISVGYRVKSIRGTQFRIWATQRLREYIIKGFSMDDDRLSGKKVFGNYFEELEYRIRKIRLSEANFYQKVKDIFVSSIDYNSKSDYAKKFFSIVQNKFHFAITGLTANEIINSRINRNKENLGLTNWKGKIVNSKDAKIAKNYLKELELKKLSLLVEQFLSFAELKSIEKEFMYMKDWLRKLDEFIVLNDKKILKNSGLISCLEMENKVRQELKFYNNKIKELS
jgi:hypothetical protein